MRPGSGANASAPSEHQRGSTETNGGDCFACCGAVFVTEMSREISNGSKKWRRPGEVAVAFFYFYPLASFLWALGCLGTVSDVT